MPDLQRVDDAFLRSSFTGFSAAGIHRAAAAGGHPVHDRALRLLDRFADDDRLGAGLEILPPTLLHGNVYGSNVISGDPSVLIDWGSARIGPALLDVTLAAGPTGLNAYRQAISRDARLLDKAAGDDHQFAIGTTWSTAVNNAMFLAAPPSAPHKPPSRCSPSRSSHHRARQALGSQPSEPRGATQRWGWPVTAAMCSKSAS